MKIAFVIHDINRKGGQERSTLEIVEGVSQKFECHVFASTAENLPGHVKFHKVPVILRRPLFVKDFFFRIFASIQLMTGRFDIVHATGACVFRADIFTLQFIHKRWNQERKRLKVSGLLRSVKENFQALVDFVSESVIVKLNPNSLYIAISDQVESDLRKLYGLKRIVKIRHGVNLTEFKIASNQKSLRQKLQLPLEKNLLLFVGAFERKGLFYLLNALGGVFTKNPNWELIVLGAGPISRAQRLCREQKIEDRVHFLGSKTNVADYYSACDLFILPSLYDPFGLVAIEALAAGTPVIVSKDSGSSDLVNENQNGWSINDGADIDELKGALTKALATSSLPQMRLAARSSVESESWQNKINQYVEVYRSIEST